MIRTSSCFALVLVVLGLTYGIQINIWDERTTCTANDQITCLSCGIAATCVLVNNELQLYNATCNSESQICYDNDGCVDKSLLYPVCYCPVGSTTALDPYNDHWYVMCVGNSRYFIDCGADYYDGKSGCTTIPPAYQDCPNAGAFATGCSTYVICTVAGAEPQPKTCPATETFDENTASCVPLPTEFACAANGAYRDHYDCKRYYVCSGTTQLDTKCCAPDEIFDETISDCKTDDGSCNTIYECKP